MPTFIMLPPLSVLVAVVVVAPLSCLCVPCESAARMDDESGECTAYGEPALYTRHAPGQAVRRAASGQRRPLQHHTIRARGRFLSEPLAPPAKTEKLFRRVSGAGGFPETAGGAGRAGGGDVGGRAAPGSPPADHCVCQEAFR